MWVGPRKLQISARGRKRQPSVFNPFRRDQCIGNFLNIRCFSFYDKYLKAVIVIQVNMKRGEYVVVEIMLNSC